MIYVGHDSDPLCLCSDCSRLREAGKREAYYQRLDAYIHHVNLYPELLACLSPTKS